MDYSTTELTEAKRQIDSILHKLQETVTTRRKTPLSATSHN